MLNPRGGGRLLNSTAGKLYRAGSKAEIVSLVADRLHGRCSTTCIRGSTAVAALAPFEELGRDAAGAPGRHRGLLPDQGPHGVVEAVSGISGCSSSASAAAGTCTTCLVRPSAWWSAISNSSLCAESGKPRNEPTLSDSRSEQMIQAAIPLT